MKSLILSFVLILSALNSYCQVEIKQARTKNVIGEVKSGGKFVAELSSTVMSTGDTLYLINYQNREYQRIISVESISFLKDGNTLEDLYNALNSFFEDKEKQSKDYNLDVQVGRRTLNLSYYKGNVMIITREGYFILNKKQLDKLFGKD
jgi:hypothetical protein